jgi:hypothetical protein
MIIGLCIIIGIILFLIYSCCVMSGIQSDNEEKYENKK